MILKGLDGNEIPLSKKWVISLSDTYSVDIDEPEDAGVILASAVVIDLVSHPDETGD